jgi:hypothetical protein
MTIMTAFYAFKFVVCAVSSIPLLADILGDFKRKPDLSDIPVNGRETANV